MKKQAINLCWPIQLSDFSKDTNQENFSRGKLKVFYKGETADHRFFSDSFSEELVKSLPYTPVVSYYDEEKEDFVGHATEQQILGIVDPCKDYSFETDEEGKVWCICDVVLYTERPDKVGDLAKKIIGHKQSLEIDPNTVKYKINYDEKKHFKNIEFTAGKFVGISVLGNDQQPAFTGSTFFAYNEKFEEKMKLLREYCESENDQIQNGGNEMDLQDFMKLSWGEVSNKVGQAIANEYQNDAYCYIVDMFEDAAIVRFYYYIEETNKLMKINYSCDDNGNVVLGNIAEVRVVYEEVPNIPEISTEAETAVGVENATKQVDNNDDDDKVEETDEEKETENDNDFINVEVSVDHEVVDVTPVIEEAVAVTEVSNAEVTEIEKVVSDGNEQISKEEDTSSASFTDSERAEFETLKREKKVNILNSYKKFLDEEEYDNYLKSIDSFEEKDLELELLKKFKERHNDVKQERAFALFAPHQNNNADKNSSIDSFIKNNL